MLIKNNYVAYVIKSLSDKILDNLEFRLLYKSLEGKHLNYFEAFINDYLKARRLEIDNRRILYRLMDTEPETIEKIILQVYKDLYPEHFYYQNKSIASEPI